MAFDMTMSLTGRREKIEHYEEAFLRMIELEEDLDCPILEGIWEAFYEGPKIYPNQAAAAVNELDSVNRFMADPKRSKSDRDQWTRTYSRLRSFFAEAHEISSMIQCFSD